MQLNGTTGQTMATSEPPEPPPRNPDRINASLTKLTKSFDTTEKSSNNKPLKPILSLDNSIVIGTTAISSLSSTPTTIIETTTNDLPNSNGNNINSNVKSGTGKTFNSGGISPSTINMNCSGTTESTVLPKPLASNKIDSKNATMTAIGSASATTVHQNGENQSITTVDKTNANDVKLMDLGVNPINGIASNVVNNKDQASTPLSTKTNNYINCDGNQNDDLDGKENSTKLKAENERLSTEIIRLRKLLENSPDGAIGGIGVDLSDSNSYDAHSTDGSGSRLDRLENELKSARNQIAQLKIERKKLKSDKNDLLAQVKQLCSSLQDKEQELRDFIRNYEQRIRETETNNVKMSTERERERWSLLKHARDEAERSLVLAQQLSSRDLQLQKTQEQLQDARRQLSGCLSDQESVLSFAPLTPPSGLMSHLTAPNSSTSGFVGNSGSGNANNIAGDRNSCNVDSTIRSSSDRESTAGDILLSDGTCENGPCITIDPDSISLVSSQNMYQYGTPKERSPTLSPLNSATYSRSVEQLGSPVDSEGQGTSLARKFPSKTGTLGLRSGRGGTWGSISRVFARSKNKSKTLSSDNESGDFTWNPITEEGYAEKLRLLREASQVPMERWRASQVLAWLDVALGMPQYSSRCSENIKSGKVLLELNDVELETGIGLVHPMHKKKMRLAIEEQRRPDLIRYPSIGQLGHTWVVSEWLPDIGLPQYAENFLNSMVDARMLDTLSKKELEKYLGVTRKFHQASIVHGIHVLRIVKYDRQTLALRRHQSENIDSDPIVWTNQRFVRWAKSINLGEYADNLKDSGVHGGLVVLEPSFSGDTMASALGIPQSKSIIRRHLTTEFDALILPARATLGQGIRSGTGVVPITGPGGLQQHYATTDRRSSGSRMISPWKGSQTSLSKTFRFNPKSRDKSFGNSTSPTPSYSSSEGAGLYATIGYPLLPPPATATPPPPSHRVSAPPAALDSPDSMGGGIYEPHRRVKSISDIEVVATSPIL